MAVIVKALCYKGETVFFNMKLAEKQKVSKKGMKRVSNLHRERIDVFQRMDSLDKREHLKLRKLGIKIVAIDKQLQKAWNFDYSPEHFTWWFRVPKCKCNVSKNWDLVGKAENSINARCPVHGFMV